MILINWNVHVRWLVLWIARYSIFHFPRASETIAKPTKIPLCMMGILEITVSSVSGTGYPWTLGTNSLISARKTNHASGFALTSRP